MKKDCYSDSDIIYRHSSMDETKTIDNFVFVLLA